MHIAKSKQSNAALEKQCINISSKRQITISAKYYEVLSISKELFCIYSKDMLILVPVKMTILH
jgi:hypothetical protein